MTATPLVLLDARVFAGGVDLSGVGNKLEVTEESEVRKKTNWRSGGAEEVLAGITSVDINAEGQWAAGDPSQVDDATWAQRRSLEPWSFAPEGDSDLASGGLVYLTRALRHKSQIFGGLGEVAGWMANACGTWPLVRGLAAHPSGVPRSTTGSGTAYQLGAVAAGQKVYANLHVLDVSGTSTPTITVKVQSDNDSGFASPTDRFSFAAATAVGGESVRAAGAITDDWWRVSWTITGSTPSFLFLVTFGIE